MRDYSLWHRSARPTQPSVYVCSVQLPRCTKFKPKPRRQILENSGASRHGSSSRRAAGAANDSHLAAFACVVLCSRVSEFASYYPKDTLDRRVLRVFPFCVRSFQVCFRRCHSLASASAASCTSAVDLLYIDAGAKRACGRVSDRRRWYGGLWRTRLLGHPGYVVFSSSLVCVQVRYPSVLSSNSSDVFIVVSFWCTRVAGV